MLRWWHLCFCLLLASLLQKPLAWTSFCSCSWIFVCTPPTVLWQCPDRCHAHRKCPLEIFSKQRPKDSPLYCRWTKLKQSEVYVGKKPTLRVTGISSLTVLGAPAMGYTQKLASGTEEICESAQWKNKKNQLLFFLPVWHSTWWVSSPDFHGFRLDI